MNKLNHINFSQYLADSEQKVHEIYKYEKKRLNSIKQRVIKEFCIDSRM